MSCSVEGCGDRVVAKGLCDKHRKRLKRNGSEYTHINQEWGEARTLRPDGYIYITIDGERVLEHRWKMEQHLKRKLTHTELVHHIDENPSNNELTNLKLVSHAEHAVLHGITGNRRKK